MAQGFLYLTAVLDWHSRYVLSWELSNTLTVDFCLTALAEALRQAPAPYIFNSDKVPPRRHLGQPVYLPGLRAGPVASRLPHQPRRAGPSHRQRLY